MDIFHLFAILVVFTAVFSYLNTRFLQIPATIGLFVAGTLFSVVVLIVGHFYPEVIAYDRQVLEQIDFSEFLLEGILSFLLFAGAINLDPEELKAQRGPILLSAFGATLLSATLVGGLTYYVLQLLGTPIPFLHALIFGALISPTDPVATLGILEHTSISESLKTKIAGESLFNDGLGYVAFLILTRIAVPVPGAEEITAWSVGLIFVQEVFGAVVLGYLLGKMVSFALSTIDNYQTEVLITLAMVLGGYTLANSLHISGPLTVVIGGIALVRGVDDRQAVSDTTQDYLVKFWELVDELLNAVLFLLIGLFILQVEFHWFIFVAGIIAIPIVVLSRFVSLKLLIESVKRRFPFERHAATIMTWGGLRGGISIALALSLAPEISKDLILGITYIVVLFSIVVQGLTLQGLVKKLEDETHETPATGA
ncbi:cation:proton antiporter [Lewinella sp. IMCC34183]|uniref:cation:proton antiporter n=1 Tax=Lewinella sp. IMCC34183 TaxID=2248762 RepID=UPI00130090EB|nr:sodium:proton antiporter [Lewinella sp. IMCC34183]